MYLKTQIHKFRVHENSDSHVSFHVVSNEWIIISTGHGHWHSSFLCGTVTDDGWTKLDTWSQQTQENKMDAMRKMKIIMIIPSLQAFIHSFICNSFSYSPLLSFIHSLACRDFARDLTLPTDRRIIESAFLARIDWLIDWLHASLRKATQQRERERDKWAFSRVRNTTQAWN